MIRVCASIIGYFGIGKNEWFLLDDDGVLSECQPPRRKHAFYGMLSSGLIPMGYAHYFSFLTVLFQSGLCSPSGRS